MKKKRTIPKKPQAVAPPPGKQKRKPAAVVVTLPVPRAYVGWLAALGLFLSCGAQPTWRDVCEHANATVQSCGATVPALTDAPCTGLARVLSTCVVDHAGGCDDLAELMRNPDRCLPDAGFDDPKELPTP